MKLDNMTAGILALHAIARNTKRPALTRRAAEDVLESLGRLDHRLELDSGADTHEVELAEGGHTVRLGRDPREAL